MRDDLRAAVRSLTSSPTFTLVALTVLALGIGATTAVFSVVDAVVIRALPFDEHDRLVAVGERWPVSEFPTIQRDPDAISSSSPQNYMDWAAQQEVFEVMAAITSGAYTLHEAGTEPEEVQAQRVTAGFFQVLRRYPVRGRPFTPDNEVDGQHQVVVLSDGLWRRRFGADPDIVGRTIPLEGANYEVVGVMAPEFAYPVGAARTTELWVPYVVPADERVRRPNWVSIYLQSIARLKPGVTLEQAQANMDQIARGLQQTYPDWNKDHLAGVRPLHDHIVGSSTRQWLLLLLGAVGMVLLIACANVANLLLARATTREREVGIRAAMGAGRGRLVRQLLVESLVMAAAGTVLAVLLAWWGVAVLKGAIPSGVPRVADIALDLRVLGASALMALATGLLFGIAPALQLSRPDMVNALKEGGRGASTGRARQHLRSALVVAEVALAVVLLVGAALFIGSFRTLIRIDPGFDPEHLLTTAIQPRIDRSVPDVEPPDYSPEIEQVLERLRQAPGVAWAGAVSGGLPLSGSMSITGISIAGREIPDEQRGISIRRVTPDYTRAMGIRLVSGRLFEATDREGSAPVILLNELAAKTYFPDGDALNQIVDVDGERTVVGIVGDVYQSSLETAPRTEAYLPMAQTRSVRSELVVRTTGDPYDVLPAVRAAVLAVLPDIPLRRVRTMDELVGERIAQRRLNMLLLGLFGLLGLVIAAAGIYGVMAYLVTQRTREIGVRVALGATRWSVTAMVLRRALWLVALGLAAGSAGAWYLAGMAEAFLFRMDVGDPRVFAAAIGVLALAAVVASLVPARRAAGVDPMIALRAE